MKVCIDPNHTRYADDIGCLDCADADAETSNVDTSRSFSFPADRLDDFEHIMGKANRKLERAGAEARFDWTLAYEDRSETQPSGIVITTPYVTVTFEKLRLALGRYTFVARLVPESAGMTVATAPGESLDGWVRPAADDMSCDHCQVKRHRVNLFVVRDEDTGQLIQLGQQCIVLYTGLEPKGLWALGFEDEVREAMGGGEGGGIGRDYSADIDQVLGLALALTNGGKAYVSRTNAGAWEKPSTAGEIKRCIHGHLPTEAEARKSDHARAERERLLQAIADGVAFSKDETLMASVKAAAATLKAGTDYADNLNIVLAAESNRVGPRNIGVLGSLVSVYYRNQEHAAEPKAQAAKGFIGAVGERVRDFTVTAAMVRQFEGDYGYTTLLVGSTADGHVIKWFSSGSKDWEPGDVLHFTAATVKAHEEYKGTDQTVLTRGHKVTVVE